MVINFSLLENGFDFICNSLNNLTLLDNSGREEHGSRGLIKYSLLHVSSGIELVFKYRLLQEDMKYIFYNMDDADKEKLKSGDFRSIDSNTIIKRLTDFCNIEFTDEELNDLKSLRMRRNKAEHFRLNESILSVENLIHKCISILSRIILEYYDTNEFSDEETELFNNMKNLLRQLKQHYEEAKAIAQNEIDRYWDISTIYKCPTCEEEFLVVENGAKCVLCDYNASPEVAADDYIENILGISKYSTVKHGGEYPLYECPECTMESMAFDEDNNIAICFNCAHQEPLHNFSNCSTCGQPYIESEGICLCPSCKNYFYSKY